MPDKTTPWTPDDGFWNEAWADMEQRLDRKRRRPVLLPWLIGLALLLGGGALVWQLADNGQADPVPLVNTTDDDRTEPAPDAAADATTRTAEASPESSAGLLPPRMQQQPPESAPSYPTHREVGAPVNRAGTQPTVAQGEGQPDVPEEGVSPAPPPPNSAVPAAGLSTIVQTIPGAYFDLLGPALALPEVIPPLSVAGEDQITPVTQTALYSLSVGTTGYVSSLKPGAYLQLSRRFGAGTWFFPLALRYDYSRRRIKVGGEESLAEAFNAPNMDLDPTIRQSLNMRLDDNRNLVDMHTAELRAGLGRQLGERITVTAGGGLGYLLTGSGPLIVNPGNGNYYALQVEERRLGDLTNLAGYQPSVGSSQNFGGEPINSEVNRLFMNGWLSADYHLASRFYLTLGLTHHFTTLYQTDALNIESTRLDVGATYRF
ncbi:MAG: hypothetical protein WA952_05025 [Lewinella sp.]